MVFSGPSQCQKSLSRQSLTCLVSRVVFRNSLLHFGQEKDSAGLSCSGGGSAL